MSNFKTRLWMVFTLFSLFLLAEQVQFRMPIGKLGLKLGNGYIGLACYKVACDNLEIALVSDSCLGVTVAGINFSSMFMKLLLSWGEKFLMYFLRNTTVALNGVSCKL